MKFNYLARTKDGQIQKGVVEASSEEAVLAILQKYGLFVTALEKAKEAPIYARQIKIFSGVSEKDVVIFSRQLSIMFKSQVPIVEALSAISRQLEKQEFKDVISKISGEVEGGATLSTAFALFPKLFSSFFISMLKSGEASGKLSEALDYLADHLEREYEFKNKIKAAMIYPILVLFVFLAVVILLIYWVLPPLMEILKESSTQELPMTTKMIMAFSDFAKTWGWTVLVALAGLVVFVLHYKRTPDGKIFFDENFLKLPILGPLLQKIYLTRFAENISTMISGGIPIAKALEISGEVVGNSVYKKIIFETRDRVRKGEMISSVLEQYPKEISPLFVQMATVGEKTGRLETSFLNIVNFYQKEVDRQIDSLIGLLEPVMLIVMGAGVAFLLVSIMLPIYQIGNF
ncbi:MAG: type II secretion system F family protein [Parcubacteria group bacterium]